MPLKHDHAGCYRCAMKSRMAWRRSASRLRNFPPSENTNGSWNLVIQIKCVLAIPSGSAVLNLDHDQSWLRFPMRSSSRRNHAQLAENGAERR